MILQKCSEEESANQVQFVIDQLNKEDAEEPLSDEESELVDDLDGEIAGIGSMEIDKEIISHGITVGESLLSSEFASEEKAKDYGIETEVGLDNENSKNIHNITNEIQTFNAMSIQTNTIDIQTDIPIQDKV